MTERPNNAWLADAINRAKQSALPLLVHAFVDGSGDPDEADADAAAMLDAIELALLALVGEITEEKLRNALRSVAEPYAEAIGAKWESVADAILGTLEWVPPDRSSHILDSWGR